MFVTRPFRAVPLLTTHLSIVPKEVKLRAARPYHGDKINIYGFAAGGEFHIL